MPDTKPDLLINSDGVCNACVSFDQRENIDWNSRYSQLTNLAKKIKSENNANWDCIVPVSGGKDSTFQVLKLLELNLNPLCVTASTCHLSSIGRVNIENIKRLGVDLIEFSPNPIVRTKLNALCLELLGDIAWPEHVSIFTIPVSLACKFKIKNIFWGENSQDEYGGPAESAKSKTLDRGWLEEFGGLLGLRVSDLLENHGFTRSELLPYIYPDGEKLSKLNIEGHFLGYYMPWDGLRNTLLSTAYGFNSHSTQVQGTMLNYEKLDNYQHGIHDYFKFLKFGFARTTDHACLHIRRDRITRKEGLEIVKRNEGLFPWSYLDKELVDILKPLNLTVEKFIHICDTFTNRKLFQCDESGNLVKDHKGNLKKLQHDNVQS